MLRQFTDTELAGAFEEAAGFGMDRLKFFNYIHSETTQIYLAQRYGEGWTINDAVESIRPVATKPVRKNKKEEQKVRAPFDTMLFDAEVEKRVQQYLKDATDVMPHDIDLARQYAAHAIHSDRWQQMLADPSTGVDEIVSLSNALERSRKSMVEISTTLGIDRNARLKQTEQISDVEKVLAIQEEAGQWVLDHGIMLTHCDTLIGWIDNEFMGHTEIHARVKCPKCFEWFEVDYVPTAEAIAQEQEPAWVKEEEDLHKAEDADVPDGV